MEKSEKWLDWAVELQSLAQAEEKNNREQVQMCFDTHAATHWETLVD